MTSTTTLEVGQNLIHRLRETASKGISVWGDLQKKAADAIETLQAENERLKADAERWRKFASLDYEMRCQWVANLSLMPVLREDIDKFILDADGSINADAERWNFAIDHQDWAVCQWQEDRKRWKPINNYVGIDAAIDAAKGGQHD